MDPRKIILTVLKICWEEKREELDKKVYELYREEIDAIDKLAESLEAEEIDRREVLEILYESLLQYPTRCSMLFDKIREYLQGIDERLEKLVLFLARGDFYEDLSEEILKNVKLRTIFTRRLVERVNNLALRRLVGANPKREELEELKKMISLAENSEVEKRLLERRRALVECISKSSS